MAYKTILVHLNSEVRARRALQYAVELSAQFEAHLIGLHVLPTFASAARLPFGTSTASRMRTALTRLDADIRSVFEQATAGRPFVSEWRSIEAESVDPAGTVIDHAHTADLVIASQADPNWQLSSRLDFPDRLALGSGRPVVVVPNQGRETGLPRNIAVAWNHRREAARAAADALPLLKLADKVSLLSVSDSAAPETSRFTSDEIEKSLIRHGINVNVAHALLTEFTTGEEIRVRSIDLEADLLVMGCYGHSRLREFALGGVTRHLLRDMTIPVLFSH